MENNNNRKTTYTVSGFRAAKGRRDYFTGKAGGYADGVSDYGTYDDYAKAKKAYDMAAKEADCRDPETAEIISLDSYTYTIDEDGFPVSDNNDIGDTLHVCDCYAEFVAEQRKTAKEAYAKLIARVAREEGDGWDYLRGILNAIARKIERDDFPATAYAEGRGLYTYSAILDESHDDEREEEILEEIHSLGSGYMPEDTKFYF